MDYIESLFKRTNVESICDFLLSDISDFEQSKLTYKERLEVASEEFRLYYQKKFPNADFAELDEFAQKLCNYTAVRETVHMEIGMQCGAFLMFQLLENFYK